MTYEFLRARNEVEECIERHDLLDTMRMIVRVDHLADGNALVLHEPHECNENHRRIA